MKKTTKATLVYIIDRLTGKLLLAKKLRKVLVGKWCGYGGGFKPEDNNNALACVTRETKEETNGVIILTPENIELIGIMKFYRGFWNIPFFSKPSFVVLCYRGVHDIITLPPETNEMGEPTLFDTRDIPWGETKNGDRVFVPEILCRIPFTGRQWFSKTEKKVFWSSMSYYDKEDIKRFAQAL